MPVLNMPRPLSKKRRRLLQGPISIYLHIWHKMDFGIMFLEILYIIFKLFSYALCVKKSKNYLQIINFCWTSSSSLLICSWKRLTFFRWGDRLEKEWFKVTLIWNDCVFVLKRFQTFIMSSEFFFNSFNLICNHWCKK